MGKFTIYGIGLTIGFGLALFGFICTQVDVANPTDNISVGKIIWDWLTPW